MSRNRMRFTLPMLALGATTTVSAQDLSTNVTSIDLSAPAAAAYCMAKHPVKVGNRPKIGPFAQAWYTVDGFEIAPLDPNYVGAVRRDFVRPHAAGNNNQTCPDACRAFGEAIITRPNAPYRGYSLRYLHDVNDPQSAKASGIGDIGAILKTYLNQNKVGAEKPGPNEMVVGIWGHPQHSIGSGSAWADYCCCQIRHPRPTD